MFSNLILRNSRRSRKENGLFFSSLVISIVAFYMILSISTQDVMLFLQKMESDAVDKLLLLIPAFYGMTLGILFFLIYFACKYQFERRRHELGVYLMLGMRRSKLFGMLLAEDFLTSILAMLIGLPVAVVLSEIVSLVTAKLVGMGIIGHQFSLSWSAIEWTLAGFLAIKLTALLILSGRISRQEIGTLLSQPTNRPKKQMPSVIYEAFLYYSQGMYDTYVNAVLSEQALNGNSLMTAYSDLNEKLDKIGIEYESYLQNMGRQLFYTVASIYITLYLAIVFLVVANTIVGVQFLMSQQKTGRRYQTLIRLGATYESLCQSAGKQIAWFMGLPVLVAAVSSLFGVRALFTGILSSRTRGTVPEMLLVSATMILLLCVIEYIYMRVVKHSSDRYLLTLMQPQREE